MWKHWNPKDYANIVENTNKVIAKSIKNNEALLQISINSKDLNNLQNFLSILADDITMYSSFHSMCSFLQYVLPDEKLRNEYSKCDLVLSNYISNLNYNIDIYKKLFAFYNIIKNNKHFDDHDKFFMRRILDGYQRNGIDLKEDKKNLLIRIKLEINKLEKSIYCSMMEYNDGESGDGALKFTRKELHGLPNIFFNTFPILSNNPIKYSIMLNRKNYMNCMRYVKSEQIRKQIEFAYHTQCKNVLDNFIKLLVLRHKHAQILGYKSHSGFRSKNQMAGSDVNITKFLTKLLHKLDYRYFKEMTTLLKLKKRDYETGKSENKHINSWDVHYYLTRWKKEYGLNEKNVSKYFTHRRVIKNIIDIYENIFDIQLRPLNMNMDMNMDMNTDNVFKWHKDVACYTVINAETQQCIGYMYLDLYARKGKISTTRCFQLQSGCNYPFTVGKQLPITCLISALNKENKFMSHGEVISLFHEFGHNMHHLFGKTKYCIFSGSNVEVDFIETPAQILDNLCWEGTILKKLSSHYRTMQPLSDNMIRKMIKIRNLNIGIFYKQHIFVALYDQLIHSSDKLLNILESSLKKKHEIVPILEDLYKQLHGQIFSYGNNTTLKIHLNKGTFMPTSWINFIGGNDAQYYSHLWSKIHSSDIYTDKFRHSMYKYSLDYAGSEFKNKVLSYGGSDDAAYIIKNYLGRDPEIDGFLKMFDLDQNAEYSFFLNTDQIREGSPEETFDTESMMTYTNRFSEIDYVPN